MASGASAKRGDIVRNLTTGKSGIVTGPSQFGRIYVTIRSDGSPFYTETWERWNTQVLSTPDKHHTPGA